MYEISSNVAYNLGDAGALSMKDVDYAALVKQLRDARRLTQEEFARELDVTVGTMNAWENGKHCPVKAQRKRLLRMAEEAGIGAPVLAAPMSADDAKSGR